MPGLLDVPPTAGGGLLSATPRKRPVVGLLADAAMAAAGYADKQDAFGAYNPPLSMLSSLLGLPAIARTLDRVSYGEPLTTGRGMTLKPRDDTTEAALSLAPVAAKYPAQVLGGFAGLAGMADTGAAKAMALFRPGTSKSVIQTEAEALAEQIRSKGWNAVVDHSGSAAGPSSYIRAVDPQTGRFLSDLRLSDHSKGAWNSQFVSDVAPSDFPDVLNKLDELRALGPTDGLKAQQAREAAEAEKIRLRLQQRLDTARAKQQAGEALTQKELNALRGAGLIE